MKTPLSSIAFGIEMKKTKTFKEFKQFKKNIASFKHSIDRLHLYYRDAFFFGLDHIKQNKNVFVSDYKIIEEVIINNTDVIINESDSVTQKKI